MSSSHRVLPFLCSALLLGACATFPEPDMRTDAAPDMTVEDEIGFDWLAERRRLVAMTGEAYGIDVQTMDDGALLLRLPAAEGFTRGSTTPTPPLQAMLDRVAHALLEVPETELRVLGHTDSIGSELYNLQLSIRRAEAVMEYLRSRGVALARLSADGRGEAEPIADNATARGRAVNRRVELIVRPFQ